METTIKNSLLLIETRRLCQSLLSNPLFEFSDFSILNLNEYSNSKLIPIQIDQLAVRELYLLKIGRLNLWITFSFTSIKFYLPTQSRSGYKSKSSTSEKIQRHKIKIEIIKLEVIKLDHIIIHLQLIYFLLTSILSFFHDLRLFFFQLLTN